MKCLEFNHKRKDGLPEWYIAEQKKLKEQFLSEKKAMLANYSEEDLEKKKTYIAAIDYLIREKLDYWGE